MEYLTLGYIIPIVIEDADKSLQIERVESGFTVTGAEVFEYDVDLDIVERLLDNVVSSIVESNPEIDLDTFLRAGNELASAVYQSPSVPWTGLYLFDQWRITNNQGEPERGPLERKITTLLGEYYSIYEPPLRTKRSKLS